MASYNYTFTSGDTVTPTKLNNARTVSDIVNADIKSDAAIAGTKVSPDFGSQNITTTGTIAAAPGSVISGSSSSAALRITQTGSGNALLVEDTTSPDATPFVVRNDGRVVQGHTAWESWWFSSSNAPQANLVDTGDGAGVNAIGFGTHGVFQMIRSNSATVDGRGAVSSGDLLGNVRFAADDGSSASAVPAAQILGLVDGTPGALNMPGRLVFSTTAPAASNPTERMRIDSAGNVGIGTTSPNAAAILTLTSTTKGFLPPRLTTAQRDAVTTPPAGLMVYNTSTNKLNFYNGSAWEAVTSA